MKKEPVKKTLKGRSLPAGAILALLLVMLPAVFVSTATAQTPQAGTTISSRSAATFEMSGNYYVVSSNEVSTVILPVYGPILLPDGTALAPAAEGRAFTGETLIFPFTLGNTGNTDDTFDLTIESVLPSGFIPQNTAVYLDVDGDGLIDPGEVVITDSGTLSTGETISLVLSADLPAGLVGGETAHLDLVARSRADTSRVDRGNVVRLVARDEARIALLLSPDRALALPGETVSWTLDFSNEGERAATEIVITDFIDHSGMTEGTQFVPGSLGSSLPGTVEYFDIEVSDWVEIAPSADRIKGARLRLAILEAGAGGTITFDTRVDAGHEWGDIFNTASVDYTGGDLQPYTLDSNEATVLIGQVSSLLLGPAGYPGAPEGSLDDRVVVTMGSVDSVCTFWHELRNDGNYVDTVRIALADSAVIPAGWTVEFIDDAEAPIPGNSLFTAELGAVGMGQARIVGLRFRSTPENFRVFTGRELEFALESRSLVDPLSVNGVLDVLVKSDMPLLSVKQSIREPNAMTGDILSFIITVENLTEETTVDSIIIVESMSPGLGFSGGSDEPSSNGNTLSWDVGSLGPGEKREVVFRASVKAGQERDELVSSAWVYGVSSLGERTADGPAMASVRLIEGVFSRKGVIFGSVFNDADDDGFRSAGEKGVQGVSVLLEDGTRAITDSTGLYSIPSVIEGRHVVRIDPKTLPDSLGVGRAGYFGLGVRGEYLIDLAPSGNRRVEFPLSAHARYVREDTSAAIGGDDPEVAGYDSGTATDAGGVSTLSGKEKTSALASKAGEAAGNGVADGSAMVEGFDAITFRSSFFEAGSAVIEDIPIREVAALGLWMRDHDDWTIMISGHTDSIPISTAEFPSNLELSLARARSVFQLLRMNGIGEKKMDYTGYGSRMPIASNDTEEGRSLNRRVEIKVIPPKDYSGEDPRLPIVLAKPDTTEKEYSLANDAGICAEIVRPDEGHVFSSRDAIDVEVLSPLASAVELYVNSIPVGREKLGQKQIDVGKGTIGYIFYNVGIKEGRNDILVVCRSHGEKNVCVRHVYRSGRPANISP
ncbi:MAG TPA: OmpA family protein, partial [Candidatus Krumholzibacterium sp.]|nr:OmpA family protein [Candidatus Krumholzibacterium sp.]